MGGGSRSYSPSPTYGRKNSLVLLSFNTTAEESLLKGQPLGVDGVGTLLHSPVIVYLARL